VDGVQSTAYIPFSAKLSVGVYKVKRAANNVSQWTANLNVNATSNLKDPYAEMNDSIEEIQLLTVVNVKFVTNFIAPPSLTAAINGQRGIVQDSFVSLFRMTG
jgi:hypothetical protein